MKTVIRTALAAALVALSGCTLTIDVNSVDPPSPQTPPAAVGACVEATAGHRVCGGAVGGGGAIAAPGGHAVGRGRAISAGQEDVSSSQHRVAQGAVSP